MNDRQMAADYIRQQAIKLLKHRVALESLTTTEYGVLGILEYRGEKHVAPYVLDCNRGNGTYKKVVRSLDAPVLTTHSCQLATYLSRNNLPYTLLDIDYGIPEYYPIAMRYKDKQAARNGRLYMNHIDEGLAIIADQALARRVFAAHPLFQSDEDLKQTQKTVVCYNSEIVMLAMEYRSVANACLPKHFPAKPQLSPLEPVNQALVADKIQNRKDLEIYNRNHPNYDQLVMYFKAWQEALGISEEQYLHYKQILHHPETVELKTC